MADDASCCAAVATDLAVAPSPGVAPSPSPRASLSRLAAVEAQLIMHLLSAADISKLARCSRFLLRCANEDHAWRCCPIFPVVVTKSIGRSLAQRRAPSLVLVWGRQRSFTCDDDEVWKPVNDPEQATVDDLLACAASLDPRHIRALDGFHQLSVAGWLGILQHAAFAYLESVTLPGPGVGKAVVNASIVDALSALPRLHTLRVSDVHRGALASLHRCPALTDLVVDTFTVTLPIAQIGHIARCARLVSLSFTACNCSLPLQELQSSPSFAHLQSLRLFVWSAHGGDIDASLSQGLASMVSLRTLSLAYCNRVDQVLQSLCLHAAAAHPFPATLRRIVVEPDLAELDTSVISQDEVARTLKAAPQISLTLLLSFSLRISMSRQEQARVADKIRAQFGAGSLSSEFGARFSIESTIAA